MINNVQKLDVSDIWKKEYHHALTTCIKYTAEANKLKEMLNILLYLPSITTALFQYQHNRLILYLSRVWWSVVDRNFNNTLDCFPPLKMSYSCTHRHMKVQYGRWNTGLTVPSVKCIGNYVFNIMYNHFDL